MRHLRARTNEYLGLRPRDPREHHILLSRNTLTFDRFSPLRLPALSVPVLVGGALFLAHPPPLVRNVLWVLWGISLLVPLISEAMIFDRRAQRIECRRGLLLLSRRTQHHRLRDVTSVAIVKRRVEGNSYNAALGTSMTTMKTYYQVVVRLQGTRTPLVVVQHEDGARAETAACRLAQFLGFRESDRRGSKVWFPSGRREARG